MKTRKDFDSQYDWLLYLQNDLGFNELMICQSYKAEEGNIFFSKWKNFLELQHQENSFNFINNCSHRSILDIEIVLDIDEIPKQFNSIKQVALYYHNKLKKEKTQHFVYFTGNKSYHIHIFDEKLRGLKNRDEIKKLIYEVLKTDGLKLGKSMIALEGANHYKSGKPKLEVDTDGFN